MNQHHVLRKRQEGLQDNYTPMDDHDATMMDSSRWVHVLSIHLKQALWYGTFVLNDPSHHHRNSHGNRIYYKDNLHDVKERQQQVSKTNCCNKMMRIALNLIDECHERIVELLSKKYTIINNFLMDGKLLKRKFGKLVFEFYAITKMTPTRKLNLLMKWFYSFTKQVLTPLRILHVVILNSIHNFEMKRSKSHEETFLIMSPTEKTSLLLTITPCIEKISNHVQVLQTWWRHLLYSFKQFRKYSSFLERIQLILSFKIVSTLLQQHKQCNPYLKYLISVCENNPDHYWTIKNLEETNDANDITDRFIQQFIKFSKVYRASHISIHVAQKLVKELFQHLHDQSKENETENGHSVYNYFNLCLNSIRSVAYNCKNHFLNRIHPTNDEQALKDRFHKSYLYSSYTVWKKISQFQNSFSDDLYSHPFWNDISSHFGTILLYSGTPLILCLALEFLIFKSVISSCNNLHDSITHQGNIYDIVEGCLTFSMEIIAWLNQEMNATHETDVTTNDVIVDKIRNLIGHFLQLDYAKIYNSILDLLLHHTFAAYFLIQKFEGHGRRVLFKQTILENFPLKHLSDFLNGSTERGHHYRKQMDELRHTLNHVTNHHKNEQHLLSTLMFIAKSFRSCSSDHPLAVCFFSILSSPLQKYLETNSEQRGLISLCEIISSNVLE
nr:unnamed protein product [Naegleria fowleri]